MSELLSPEGVPREEAVLELPRPKMIDADDPLDVERQVLSDLPEMLDVVAEYIDEAAKMLANAERTRIIRGDRHVDAQDVADIYDESVRAGALARLNGAAKALCSAAAELD